LPPITQLSTFVLLTIVAVFVSFCLNSDSEPVCGPVVTRSSVAENERVEYSCSMAYDWLPRHSNNFPQINVSFGWEGVPETLTTTELSSNHPGKSEASMTVSARKPSIPAQSCTIRFTFAPQPHLSHRFTFANNPLSHTCQTDPIHVQRKFFY